VRHNNPVTVQWRLPVWSLCVWLGPVLDTYFPFFSLSLPSAECFVVPVTECATRSAKLKQSTQWMLLSPCRAARSSKATCTSTSGGAVSTLTLNFSSQHSHCHGKPGIIKEWSNCYTQHGNIMKNSIFFSCTLYFV